MYKYTDYLNTYGRIMQFNKNKQEPFHRWYPFVEGYSKEFIQSIINEIGNNNLICLEPFSGSGTTALELQNMDIKCISFEINPLMFLIGQVKLERSYTLDETKYWFHYICEKRVSCENIVLTSEFNTLYPNKKNKKWNYNTEVGYAVEKLRQTINNISVNKYRDLFIVALAAILLDVSNLYRNGKCLSYKKDWKTRNITQQDVFDKFDDKVVNELLTDIKSLKGKTKVNNKKLLYNEDSRTAIEQLVDNDSIDLVITSPPYLNSRDYTDTYILELKTLGFTVNAEEIKNLRKKTLRSHVQVKWDDNMTVSNDLLDNVLQQLNNAASHENVWNNSIIDMVRLYFVDMRQIFAELYKKLRIGGKIYFNVSNSAYFNILINTIEICASIAEKEGFKVIEIRKARYLKTSPQQKERVGKLLEGVIILER